MYRKFAWSILVLAFGVSVCGLHSASTLPSFDLTRPEEARQWHGPHHLSHFEPVAEGLRMVIAGHDPYIHSPARDFPANQLLWVKIRLKSSSGGMAQLFFFDRHATEDQSRRFIVPQDQWAEIRLPLPALGPQYRFRLDPPGNSGEAVLAFIQFEPRAEFTPPPVPWQPPAPGRRRVVKSGLVECWDAPDSRWGVEMRVNGHAMAYAHPRLQISYAHEMKQHWMDIPLPVVRMTPSIYQLEAVWKDVRGAEWRYAQEFRAGSANVVEVRTVLETSQDTEVLYVPMFLLAAGEGTFGTNKNQALFAGLEYLENEPSSSEADIIGPESRRQVPANHKITFPLMVVQERGHYVALAYDNHLGFSAVFDSPDRLYGSRGHVMGVIWPESDGANRPEGSLVPHFPRLLRGGEKVECRLRLMGGEGSTVIPAVQQYVALHGLPAYAKNYMDLPAYEELAARGWLRSKVREGNRYRHAVWPGFNAQPAADAALYMTWLARRESPFAQELRQAAAEALALVPSRNYFHSAISHVRGPAVPLVFGQVSDNINTAREYAASQLKRLGDDYLVFYRPTPGGPDYARTYWTNHANGLTFQPLAEALQAAAFCGDRELTARALTALRAQKRYNHGVPRGAQTWEIPLHTPDILASAHLVKAYVLGYELSGDSAFLEQARYWAWTGIPFVYLVNPTQGKVGLYSTIAVLGATTWKAPVWFGQPVQWCGLVYADSLYRLAEADPRGIWRTVADGITVAGLQHTWKAEDTNRVGLLPDYFLLREQQADGPAINPGTVGANAVNYFTQVPLWDFKRFRRAGFNVHAPGHIRIQQENAQSARFQVMGWPSQPYFVLLSGLSATPRLKLNGRDLPLQPPHEVGHAQGWMALQVQGPAILEVQFP
ncbi:hypothetical protein NXS98_04750 [Fontisphaera persica]|uniref:hypothetical protein n=1 Tax=Fontisphaera persica TaxID=2974023 RepID=UPI0024BF11FC|nr:hypothetical protein [Fontisphaera persica]WCJ60445.1 hypothetical protein NXS98_04750 [Fontisphaera persica]